MEPRLDLYRNDPKPSKWHGLDNGYALHCMVNGYHWLKIVYLSQEYRLRLQE